MLYESNVQVTVLAVQRQWKDRNFSYFVLASENDGRREKLPPFFSPPEGTRDFEKEKDREMRMKNKQQKIS